MEYIDLPAEAEVAKRRKPEKLAIFFYKTDGGVKKTSHVTCHTSP